MIRSLTAVFLFASFDVAAEVTLTDINNNEVADADEVMGNFNALKQGVEANATAIDALPTPPTNCTTDQFIKWNGSAWVCSDLERVEELTDDDFGSVICPSGKKVTGGGCRVILHQVDNCLELTSQPYSGIAGWECRAIGSGCELRHVFAVCL